MESKLADARFLQRCHGWAAVAWALSLAPTYVWLRTSVAYVIFISVYAIVLSHIVAWQESRVEVKQDGLEEQHGPDRGG